MIHFVTTLPNFANSALIHGSRMSIFCTIRQGCLVVLLEARKTETENETMGGGGTHRAEGGGGGRERIAVGGHGIKPGGPWVLVIKRIYSRFTSESFLMLLHTAEWYSLGASSKPRLAALPIALIHPIGRPRVESGREQQMGQTVAETQRA